MMKHGKALAALVLALPLMSGCFGTTTEDELVIMDHGAFDYMHQAIADAFENRTGAKIVLTGEQDAGSALKRAIDSKGNPFADVIYGVDNAMFHQAARAGIFEPYTSPNLVNVDTSVVRLDDFRRNGLLLATPADHGYVSVNYDINIPSPPTSLRQLAESSWASRLVVENPITSSPGLGFLIATVATFGENDDYDYLDFWRDLFKNGTIVTDDWSTAYEVHFSAGYGKADASRFRGDRQLVVSYTTSPAAEVYFGAPARPSGSLEPASGVFHQVETVAILKGAKHPELARKFVDFVLSREFQDLVSANMAVYPVVKGAHVEDAYATYATAPAALKPAGFSSLQLDQNVDRWLSEWRSVYEDARP